MKIGHNALITCVLLVICLFFLVIGIVTINEAHSFYEYSSRTPVDGKISPHYEILKDGYTLAQTFFLLAAGLMIVALLLPRLQSISFGGMSINMRELTEKIDAIAQQQNILQQSHLDDTYAGKNVDTAVLDELKSAVSSASADKKQKVTHPDDPQKGLWGGLSKVGSRQLTAVVTRTSIPELYEVALTVRSLDKNDPVKGMVTFHLHDSFQNQNPAISAVNNEATLRLKKVYGAFTVGAEADKGKTKLELDLSELPLPFPDFLSR